MTWLNRLSIYQKILFISITVILLLSMTLGIIIWNSMDDIAARQLKKRGNEIASHLASLAANYVLIDDHYSLHELINHALNSSEDIRYILVIDTNNRLIAHTFASGIPKGLFSQNSSPITSGYRTATLHSTEGTILDTIVPIENGALGFIRVGMTEAHTRKLINNKFQDIVFATFIICCIAAVLSSKVTLLITKPITQLSSVAEAITKGNLDLRADIRDEGEVGKLAEAFNEMASSLIIANTDKETLLNELQAKEQLRATLLQKLITVQEDERKRLSRELHDETSQAVTSLMVTMRVLAEEATDNGQRDALLTSRDIAAGILREIRDMAVELRPPVLDDLGLIPAIEKYVERINTRYGLDIYLDTKEIVNKIDGQIAVALYRIVQEGINNIIKHSGAMKVKVIVQEQPDEILLTIADDGRGISSADLQKAQKENRLGIYGMSERAELLGGRFSIGTYEEGGTVLNISIPKYREMQV
jgi:signal transduction histidine kinase